MAEKRFVARRITESDKIRTLANQNKYQALFLYQALLAYTDREGRLNANPMLLKGGMFEGYNLTTNNLAEGVRDLARVGLVILYSHERHAWLIQYTKFLTEHGGFNTPHPKEPPSQFASPDDAGSVVWDDNGGSREHAGNIPGNLQGEVEVYVEVDGKVEDGKPPVDQTDDSGSCEARTMHLLTTGQSETQDAPRARTFFNRLIGTDNAKHPQCRDNLTRWYQDYTEPEIRALWKKARDNPENKARLWYFIDALNGLKATGGKPIDPGPTPEEIRAFWGDTN